MNKALLIQSDGALQASLEYEWRELTAYAVYPKTRYLPLRVRVVIDFLAAYFDRDEPYWDREIASATKSSGRRRDCQNDDFGR